MNAFIDTVQNRERLYMHRSCDDCTNIIIYITKQLNVVLI